MIVRCISNSISRLSSEEQENYQVETGKITGLTVGKEYPVFATASSRKGTEYALCDDDVDSYPNFYHAQLFEIVDKTLPANWQCDYLSSRSYPFLCSFPEWVENADESEDGFYGRLVEGSRSYELEIWEKYKTQYLNSDFLYRQALKEYEERVQIAREHGWELPPKPEINS